MKRYLTGIDWIVNTLDYTGKAQSGIGNHSEVILELKNPPHHKALAEELNSFMQKFPLLNGFPSRAINLCPYWRMPAIKKALFVRLHIVKLESDFEYISAMAAQVNMRFQNKREHLVFTLVETGQKTFLAMAFDHRILDAKGAEAFLHLFQQYCQNDAPLEVSLTSPAHLNNWREKFSAGKQLNRFLLQLTKTPLRTLSFDPRSEPCKFKVIHLNSEQTERLTGVAFQRAGYLMFMPYLLARSIQIMHEIFQEKNIAGATYLIPVPMDTRSKETAQKEIFFNHFSFLLFKISADKINDLAGLLAEIKNQMYEQIKSRVPEAIINASFLLRIASLPLVNFFLKLISKKHFASFYFTCLNNTSQPDRFMQEQLGNIFHLPRTPKPPGVGVFFNQFDNKLNITLSYFDDLLNNQQVDQIIKELRGLGNEN